MILNRETLTPAKRVPLDAGRWSRVAVSNKGIEATDGCCILVRTHRTNPEGHDKVPVVYGVAGRTNPMFAHRIMVEAADLAHLLDRPQPLRKWNQVIHLVRIVTDEQSVIAVITDLQRHHEVITLNLPEDQRWPDTDRLIESQEQPVVVIGYDVARLKKLVDTLEDAGAEAVQFAITGPKTGTYFSATSGGGSLIDGILMPMRLLGNLPTKGEAWATPQAPEEVKA